MFLAVRDFLTRAGWLYLRLRRSGLFVRPERPADRPSLAWPPVADIVSATLRAIFSALPTSIPKRIETKGARQS